MATNFYFQNGNTSGTTNEQRLVEDLIIESLKIYGHDVFYLPRTIANKDPILGEDPTSYFAEFYPLEMYMENVQGFEGDGELFSKFGFEIRDQATFVVSKRRWESVVGDESISLQLPTRPAEGDLLYFPKTKSFFEIKFVDFLNPFYQLGKIYVYKLSCELFEFSSEFFNTGNSEVDNLLNNLSEDAYQWQVLKEDGSLLLNTNDDSIILESYATTIADPLSDSEQLELEAESIIDFTTINPFGEVQVRP